MPYVSQKVLRETINIQDIESEARKKWETEQRRRRRLETWIVKSLPFGVLLMLIVFYLLSAPHTSEVLNRVTPFWGQFSPVGWELGLLIVSALRETGWKGWLTGGVLGTLLSMSILINVAGGFLAVVAAGAKEVGVSDISTLTIQQLLDKFSSLPATYQVVMMLIIPIGAVIPVIAKLGGEIIIKLALGRVKLETESEEIRWLRDVQRVMFAALYESAMKLGAGYATADTFATEITERYYRTRTDNASRAIGTSIQTTMSQATPTAHRQAGFLSHLQATGQSQTVPGSPNAFNLSQENFVSDDFLGQKDTNDSLNAVQGGTVPKLSKKHVIEWLSQHEEYQLLSDREVSKIYTQEHFGSATEAGYKTIQRAKQDMGLR